jgi:DNA-directed RNA polymerase subunit RPC12/RpoP
MEILCKLLTRGKHKFVLVNHRYRCRYCGILRSRVLWKPRKKVITQSTGVNWEDVGFPQGEYIEKAPDHT